MCILNFVFVIYKRIDVISASSYPFVSLQFGDYRQSSLHRHDITTKFIIMRI